MTSVTLALEPRRVARALALSAAAVVAVSIVGQLAWQLTGDIRLRGVAHFLYVNEERNLPTAYASLLLATATLLLVVVCALEARRGGGALRYWVVLTCGFAWMTADEALSFHERAMRPMRRLLGSDELGILYHAWIVPGLVIVAVLAAFFARFLLRLPSPTRGRFLFAASLYLAGAIGFEMIGGYFDEKHGIDALVSAGETGLLMLQYGVLTTTEESLEMAGVIFFIWALLGYMADPGAELKVLFFQPGIRPKS